VSRRYRRSAAAVKRVVGEHAVLLPTEGALPEGVLLFLLDGPVAAQVWEGLSEPRTLDELVDLVVEGFGVERSVAEADLVTFLGQVEAAGLLEVDG
jgi:hypothetical protein